MKPIQNVLKSLVLLVMLHAPVAWMNQVEEQKQIFKDALKKIAEVDKGGVGYKAGNLVLMTDLAMKLNAQESVKKTNYTFQTPGF